MPNELTPKVSWKFVNPIGYMWPEKDKQLIENALAKVIKYHESNVWLLYYVRDEGGLPMYRAARFTWELSMLAGRTPEELIKQIEGEYNEHFEIK